MMQFWNEPDRERLLRAHEVLTTWGTENQLKRRKYKSNTLVIIEWLKDHAKKKRKIQTSTVEDDIWRNARRTDIHILLHDVDAALALPNWLGHEDERRAILVYYYLFLRAPLGRVARELDCKPWEVEEVMKKALRRFVLVY